MKLTGSVLVMPIKGLIQWARTSQKSGTLAARDGRGKEIRLTFLDGFRRSIYQHNFTREDIPVVAIGAEALAELDLDPNAGFVLSRIDGRTTVKRLLEMSPLEEVESLRVFKRLLDAKIIDFPRRCDSGWFKGGVPEPT